MRMRALAVVAAALAVGAGIAPAAAHAAPPDAAQPRAAQSRAAQPRGHGGVAAHWRFDDSAAMLADVARVVGADRLWNAGLTGEGVGVALVDTGVVPVPGLRADHVANGPDLSLDSVNGDVRYLDTYGHGTHLAGIIAGSGNGFRGVAPGATLTSVKVGAADGAVDVSQVIAGL